MRAVSLGEKLSGSFWGAGPSMRVVSVQYHSAESTHYNVMPHRACGLITSRGQCSPSHDARLHFTSFNTPPLLIINTTAMP